VTGVQTCALPIYGAPPAEADSQALLLKALDLGYTFFDTAAIYGMGANETLVGKTLKDKRRHFTLASKGGLSAVNGARVIDGSPAAIRRNCEDSLKRLQTDRIDLYYLHRWDKKVPIEDSVGEMAALRREGKIGALGLSEISGPTLRRAYKVHPIAAVQNEYSLWSRNPEISLIDACRDLGVTLVAFGSVGRGFFGGALTTMDGLPKSDIRLSMPRFTAPNFEANLKLLDALRALAREAGRTPAQLALAWTLGRGGDVVSIPGTTRLDHLAENAIAADITLDADMAHRLEMLFDHSAVRGARYAPQAQAQVDTEEWAV
jgi:aryl-alcohol dehydrogenase-like predicted oxidoreductase